MNEADGYFSDTNSSASEFSSSGSEVDENKDGDEDNDDGEDNVKCLDLWEKGYRDPLFSPAAEPADEEQQDEEKLSKKLTDYGDFNKVWHKLHEMVAFEKALDYIDRDETFWQFMERMREYDENGTHHDVARWEGYPEPEDELHHAGKDGHWTLTNRDDTDSQQKHKDSDVALLTLNKMTMQR